VWTEFIWFRLGSYGGLCENGYEAFGSVKGTEICDQLSNC
jgi:hypothetical protein